MPANLQRCRALTFDLIGTCTNWHAVVSKCLRTHGLTDESADRFAHHWRGAFFRYLKDLSAKGEMMEIVEVYKRTLTEVQAEFSIREGLWNEDVVADLVSSWEEAEAWPDTATGLRLLRQKFIVIGLSNGSTLTTIKTNRRNALDYDAIFNSDIIGAYKPNSKIYETTLKALRGGEGEVAMVAAHKYDLEAARKHGMRTIYIRRPTEDMDETIAEGDFDLVVGEGGLIELARRLGCEV